MKLTHRSITLITLTIALQSPAQANSIAGQWTYRADVFGGECSPFGETHETTVTIQQTDNQFTAQGGLTCQGRCMEADKHRGIGSGTITDDRLQSQDAENILRWFGTLSPDSSTIQGKATCQMSGGGTGKGEFPFTMQRQPTKTSTPQSPLPPNGLRPDFDDNESTPTAQPTQPVPTENPSPTTNLTGDWVVFLETPLSNYGVANRITQTGNTFTLQSGISGESFTGKITDDRIETTIPRTSPGQLSPNSNIIRFSGMAMVRLGSPTCEAIATCQLP